MSIFSIVLFLHIVGALGVFVALGLEWTGLRQIQSAISSDQVRGWMGILKSLRKFGLASMLATVISGLYMIVAHVGAKPWIIVTIGALVLIIAIAQVLTAPRMAAVGRALAAGKGTLSETFHSLANHPLLQVSIQTRAAIALGIVFLKVARPDLAGSLATVAAAILLGIASVIPFYRRANVQEKLAQ